jgi:hypothetical protein
MFEKDERIEAMTEALYGLTANLNRGDILTHEMIRPVLGCEPNEYPWQLCVDKVRARLEKEREIATWPEKTVGYRLLTVDEQIADLPRWRTRRAIRQQRKARRSAATLSVKGLSHHQRLVLAHTLEMLNRSQASLRREMKDHATATRPAAFLPRREPIPARRRETTAIAESRA